MSGSGGRRGARLPEFLFIVRFFPAIAILLFPLLDPHPSSSSASARIFATENDGFFRSFSVSDGLSQSTGQDILQDSLGHLWIGTQDGLNRLTGNGFRVYRREEGNPRSLSNNVIMELFEDSRKTLWIGTFQGGLNRYDPASDSFERFTAGTDARSLRSDQVRDLAENGKGELLVATDRGLDILDAARERVRRISATDGLYVDRLFVDGEGTVWMGCNTGLVRLNSDESVSVFFPPLDGSRQVASLTSGEGREILVVFETDALFLFDPATERFRPYPRRHPELATANYLTVERTSRGTLWIGTFDKGLFRDDGPGTPILHFRRNPEYPGTLAGNAVRRLYEDKNGHLWVGTYYNGVSVFAPERQKFHVVRSDPQNSSSLLDNMVRGFWLDEEKGELWVATLQGVSRWIPRSGGYRRYTADDGFPKNLAARVRGMYRAPDGRLFVFCFGGLAVYDGAQDRFVPYVPPGELPEGYRSDRTLTLHLDRWGNEWIATEDGVFRRDSQGKWTRFVHDDGDPRSLASNYITRFFEDREGRVWISSESAGVSIWTPGLDGFDTLAHRMDDPESLGSNNLFAFAETDDAFWLGTQGGGLSRFDKGTGKIRNYGFQDGLPNETIYAVLPGAEEELWLSTNNGVARFNPRDGAVRAFDEYDGLQSREFNNFAFFRSGDGTLFLGGVAGFNYFRPQEPDGGVPARGVVLDALLVRGENRNDAWMLNTAGSVDLAWHEKDLTLVYSPVDLSAGDRIEFMYRLVGYDEDWKRVGHRRVAEYTNLPDGEYLFRIKASNGSGEWGEDAAEYRIRIGVPPWKTPFAYVVYVLGGILLMFSVYTFAARRQSKALRKAEEERVRLEDLVRERTSELVQANRELAVLASRDTLTGLFNRRKFDETFAAEFFRADRFDRPLSLALGDIDQFKMLNDREGHLFGDRVLAAVAESLSAGIRSTDVLARWGGDEFALLMPETGTDEALVVMERLRRGLAEVGRRFGREISMSFGVAGNVRDETAENLMHRADEALLRGKREGRDRVVLSDPPE